jgi:hypothetical protein
MRELSKRMQGDQQRDDRETDQPAPGRVTQVERVMRKADGNGVHAGADEALARAGSSSGAPLPSAIRRKFEGSLGADLSSVRVHTGSESAAAAGAVSARAYTVGQQIHFNAGQYDPESSSGQHLLAHEVAHTVQQTGALQKKPEVSQPGDAHEHEADRAADAMVAGRAFTVGRASGISRKNHQFEYLAYYYSKPNIEPLDWNKQKFEGDAPLVWRGDDAPKFKEKKVNNFYLKAGMEEFPKVWTETMKIFQDVGPKMSSYRSRKQAVGGLPGNEKKNPISQETIGATFGPDLEAKIRAFDLGGVKTGEKREKFEAARHQLSIATKELEQADLAIKTAANNVKIQADVVDNAKELAFTMELQRRQNDLEFNREHLLAEKGQVTEAVGAIVKVVKAIATKDPKDIAEGVESVVTFGINLKYEADIKAINHQIRDLKNQVAKINEGIFQRGVEIAMLGFDNAQLALETARKGYGIAVEKYFLASNAYSTAVGAAAEEAAPKDAKQLQSAVESIPTMRVLKDECEKLALACEPPKYNDIVGYGFRLADNAWDFNYHIGQLKGAQRELLNDSHQWAERLASLKPLL